MNIKSCAAGLCITGVLLCSTGASWGAEDAGGKVSKATVTKLTGKLLAGQGVQQDLGMVEIPSDRWFSLRAVTRTPSFDLPYFSGTRTRYFLDSRTGYLLGVDPNEALVSATDSFVPNELLNINPTSISFHVLVYTDQSLSAQSFNYTVNMRHQRGSQRLLVQLSNGGDTDATRVNQPLNLDVHLAVE